MPITLRKPTDPNYSAGWNQPGCLPDSTEGPATFETFSEARAYLHREVERFWDEDYQASDDADWIESSDERWLPVHTALHNTSEGVAKRELGRTFSQTTGDGRLTFWIEPIEG